MKPVIAIAVVGAFAIAGLSLNAVPASAAQKSSATDVSSAKKKSKQAHSSKGARSYNGYRSAYGQYGPAYRRPYAADPSFSPSGRPYQPNIYSPCTIDLGYGRFTSCDR